MSELKHLYDGLPYTEPEFIAEGMLLVRQQVAKRLRLCPGWRHLTDDFVGDGNVALTVLLHTPNVKDPAAWLTTAVRRSINRQTEHDPAAALIREPASGPGSTVLQDALELCRDDVDRRIIAGRAEGFSDPELEGQVGISSQAIGVRRRRIRDDFHAGHSPTDRTSKGRNPPA